MEMQLDPIYFNQIEQKKKLYETRIYDKKRQAIKLLDIIIFTNKETKKTFNAKITELSYFQNFTEALTEVGIKKVLPNTGSLVEGIKIYESFPHKEYGNYKEAAKKYGVVRLKFQIV
jgi:ASC-1-like (ASCH) protein